MTLEEMNRDNEIYDRAMALTDRLFPLKPTVITGSYQTKEMVDAGWRAIDWNGMAMKLRKTMFPVFHKRIAAKVEQRGTRGWRNIAHRNAKIRMKKDAA